MGASCSNESKPRQRTRQNIEAQLAADVEDVSNAITLRVRELGGGDNDEVHERPTYFCRDQSVVVVYG